MILKLSSHLLSSFPLTHAHNLFTLAPGNSLVPVHVVHSSLLFVLKAFIRFVEQRERSRGGIFRAVSTTTIQVSRRRELIGVQFLRERFVFALHVVRRAIFRQAKDPVIVLGARKRVFPEKILLVHDDSIWFGSSDVTFVLFMYGTSTRKTKEKKTKEIWEDFFAFFFATNFRTK